jgi:hypothetical protein
MRGEQALLQMLSTIQLDEAKFSDLGPSVNLFLDMTRDQVFFNETKLEPFVEALIS